MAVVRCALVRTATGEVVNVIAYDPAGSYSAPAGHELVDPNGQTCAQGYTWNGSTFSPPVPSADPLAQEIQTLRAYATDDDLDAYLATATPTNAQSLAAIKGTVRALRALIRAAREIAG